MLAQFISIEGTAYILTDFYFGVLKVELNVCELFVPDWWFLGGHFCFLNVIC